LKDWKQLEGGNEMTVTINDTVYRLHRGDMLIKQNDKIKIVEGTFNDQ
jgi:hypothetical protein